MPIRSNATQEVLDRDGQPIAPKSSTAAVLDLLALGAGAVMLLSAGKSRSMVGGLIKGGVAAARPRTRARWAKLLGRCPAPSAGRGAEQVALRKM